MAGEVQQLIDELVTIQNAITPPTGEKDIAAAYDEPPADPTIFPCFLNLEAGAQVVRELHRRQVTHTINMSLLLAAADQKYSVRTRRLWVGAVLDAFDIKLRLNGQAHYAHIDTIEYDPIEWNGKAYVGATFVLTVLVDGAFAFAS